MSTFEVGGGVAWGLACRRVAAVVLLGAYAAVFTWPVASTTMRESVAVVAPQRPLIDEVFGTGCSLVPAFEGGRPIGWKVFGVRADSVRFRAGLRNGDVLVAINERRIASPADALLVYEAHRRNRALRLDVLRAGQPLRIVVDADG